MEHQLIEQAKGGDHGAFLQLLGEYDRALMGVIYRFTADRWDREDLYQNIAIACFTSLKRFKYRSSFKTWLYRLAFNQCMSYMRKNRKPSETYDQLSITPDMEQKARIGAIHSALQRLNGPQRIAFHLFYIEDWDVGEIGELLQIRTGTVKSHLNRARNKIRADKEVHQWQMEAI